MVLRCSLLGHDFGDTEIEREREERGSEVVVTITEYEECARCGEIDVITENTEVTSLDTRGADEPADVPESLEPADTPADTDESAASVAGDESADGSEPADAAPAAADPADADEPDHPAVDDPPADEEITDDAEILVDDEEPDPDREHGEWPESDDVGPPAGAENEPTAWPEDEPPAESDADRSEPAEPAESVAPPESDETPSGSATPEAESDRASSGTEHDSGAGTGIASAQPAPAPGETDRADDVRTEFFCPRCDFVAPDDRGSLRSGDICPDCRKGYLSERER